jgi:hypothetical protein
MQAPSQVTMASPITVKDRTDNRSSSLDHSTAANTAATMSVADSAIQQRRIEQYIHDVFATAYQADVRHFLPLLLGIRETGGEYIAAAGLQPANMDTLYLEKYLDGPVEKILGNRMQLDIDRRHIIEAGNLAITNRGGARNLITTLLAYLYQAGYQWAVFTAVPVLINKFRKLGLPLTKLADADPHRLGQEADMWGRYYDYKPTVVAGHIPTGFYLLQQRGIARHESQQQRSSPSFIYRSSRRLGRLS